MDESELGEIVGAKDNFKMNWPAFWACVISLIIIGWCLGLIIDPMPATTIECPEEDWVQIAGLDNGGPNNVIVFCAPPG